MTNETNDTPVAAPAKSAKGAAAAAPAANRIKDAIAARFQGYKAKRDELIAEGNSDEVLQRRFNAAADFGSYIEGASDIGAALGGFNEAESKIVDVVKRAVDLDIERLENEADQAELLG